MKRFSTYIEENVQQVQEAARGTQGHVYQNGIAQNIKNALIAQGKASNYTIKVAPPSSTAPDILIERADEKLIIECKMDNAQSGAITWRYSGGVWSIYSTPKSTSACQQNSSLCQQILNMLSSLNVVNRIEDIFSELAVWCPELKLNANQPEIPFKFCKEFYPLLLDKYPTAAYGSEGMPGGDSETCGGDDALCTGANRKGKWQIPVPLTYWTMLNSMMNGDNYLQIKGTGLLAVNPNSLPSWFNSIAGIPFIDQITSPPTGNIELRLKASGCKFNGTKQKRNLIITPPGVISKISDWLLGRGKSKPPAVGDFIHAYGLQGGNFKTAHVPFKQGLIQTARSNVHKDDKPLKYVLGGEKPPSGAIMIGKIDELISTSPDQAGNILVECVMHHRTGTCSFETNLRIKKMSGISTPINLDKKSDCATFASAFK